MGQLLSLTFTPYLKDGEDMKYRHNLPQLGDKMFLTDGGLETTLVFHEGIHLPEFAAIDEFRSSEGVARIDAYYRQYLELARNYEAPFVLESPTWRASQGWCDPLGYSREELEKLNGMAIAMMLNLREEFETREAPIVVSGCIGPEGDGYSPDRVMSAEDAQAYHQHQVDVLAGEGVDFITGVTITYVEEAIGIVRAAQQAGIPVVISFTVETDGRLVTGDMIGDAITRVDRETDGGPVYYMINCAHPTHFESALSGDWILRVRGIRANASKCSHAELDAAEELDDGNPSEFGGDYRRLKQRLPHLSVVGGCCGTDVRHVAAVAAFCL